MSDGKTHATFTTGASFGILTTSVLSNHITVIDGIIASVGCLIGLFVSPDLDVDGGHIGSYYARKAGMGFLFDVFWQPYRESLKHRSFWSHFPIVSTIIRLLYILFPPSIFIFKDQKTSFSRILFLLIPSTLLSVVPVVIVLLLYSVQIDIIPYVTPLVAGLIISDIGHWLKDL